jgi:hypothetical protein
VEPRQHSDEPNPAAQAHPLPGQRRVPGPPPGAPVAPVRPGRPRKVGRLRLVLAVVGGVFALLCLGGVGVVFVLYDQATKPDRSAPDVVVDNYLRAFLVDRNDAAATQYTCPDASVTDLQSFRADIQDREKQHSIDILVSWGSLAVQGEGERRSVTVDVRRTVSDATERDTSTWQFDVADNDGWRVCGVRRLA